MNSGDALRTIQRECPCPPIPHHLFLPYDMPSSHRGTNHHDVCAPQCSSVAVSTTQRTHRVMHDAASLCGGTSSHERATKQSRASPSMSFFPPPTAHLLLIAKKHSRQPVRCGRCMESERGLKSLGGCSRQALAYSRARRPSASPSDSRCIPLPRLAKSARFHAERW